MNTGMTALQERNRRVQYARELGIAKPHTLKKEALEAAITEAEAVKAAEKAKVAADPTQDGEIHDCEHRRMQVLVSGEWVCPAECTEPQEEKVADVLAEREATREAWLLSAVEKLIPLLEQAGATNIRNRKIQVSVSFPSKTIRKRIGECWAAVASEGGEVNHLFVSPLLDDTVEVLGVLAHELIHADDNCESSKHNGHFRRVALALGLTGKMTSTEVGEDLKPILKDLAEELGPYPHVKLKLDANIKKQTTRLVKVHCVDLDCPYLDDSGKGYTIRVTQKWIEIGLPTCPCGTEMTVAD